MIAAVGTAEDAGSFCFCEEHFRQASQPLEEGREGVVDAEVDAFPLASLFKGVEIKQTANAIHQQSDLATAEDGNLQLGEKLVCEGIHLENIKLERDASLRPPYLGNQLGEELISLVKKLNVIPSFIHDALLNHILVDIV